jgi:hypothetical protein
MLKILLNIEITIDYVTKEIFLKKVNPNLNKNICYFKKSFPYRYILPPRKCPLQTIEGPGSKSPRPSLFFSTRFPRRQFLAINAVSRH